MGITGPLEEFFFPVPEFSHLIFSYILDGVAILACGATLILFVIKLASQARV